MGNNVIEDEMRRQAIPCYGLWEYTHTDEDGVMEFQLLGITEDEEAAAAWVAYQRTSHVFGVRVLDSLQGVSDSANEP